MEGVGGHYVAGDSLDFDGGLAESIRLAEGSFAREDHEEDIQHDRVIVAATSYEWVIYFLLDRHNGNIFSN